MRTRTPLARLLTAAGSVLMLVTMLAVTPAGTGASAASAAGAAVTAAGDYATPLTIDLTGRFADDTDRAPRTGMVVGTVASAWTAGQDVTTNRFGFDFTAACTVDAGQTCAAITPALAYHWDFGDGRTETTTTPRPAAPIVYTRPGVYTVTVTVDNRTSGPSTTSTYSGRSSIQVFVSHRYADVDAADAGTGKTSPGDAEQIWAVSALGLLGPCRTYFPSSTTRVAGEQGGDPGRAEFCPQAPTGRAPAAPDGTLGAVTFTVDGIYGRDCLASADACGLPADVFAENASPAGDPTAVCGPDCRAQLRQLELLSDADQVVYRNDVCADNQVAVRGRNTLAVGVELGCVTYGDFLTALGKAVDSSGDSGTLAKACPTGPPTPTRARRAAALLTPAADAAGMPAAVRVCDLGAALTKGEAYTLLALAAGIDTDTSAPVLAQLRDLADPTLQGGSTPHPVRGLVGGLLVAGAPLVGSLDCPDKRLAQRSGLDPKSCFNIGDGVTRRQAAQLLSFLVLTPSGHAGNLRVTLTSSAPTTELGRPVQLTATVHAPAWYPADAVVTLAWKPTPAGDLACGTESVTVGSDRSVTRSCLFSPRTDPGDVGVPVSVTVTDDQGTSTTTVTTVVTVVNDAPTVSANSTLTLSPPSPREGDVVTGTFTYRDPQGNPVTFGVRSCVPDVDESCVSTAPTFPRSDDRARLVTSDQSTATLSQTAPTDLGTVEVAAVTSTTVTFKHTPADPDNNGDVDFVLQWCDSGDACGTRYVRLSVAAVNDAPAPLDLVTVTTTDTPAEFDVGGSDARDTSQPGYPAPDTPIVEYLLCSVPAPGQGTVQVKDAAGTWVTASTGTSTTNKRLRFVPAVGVYGTFTATYKVRDAGAPGTLWSGGAAGCGTGVAAVTVTNQNPVSPPTAALTLSTDVTEAFSGDVTADASGSTAGAGNANYTFAWGDGTITGPQASPVATHRYTPTRDTKHTVTVTVRDSAGRSAAADQRLTVRANLAGNPTFESGADRVTGGPGTTVTAVGDAARSGTRGLRATLVSGSTCTVRDNPATLAGATVAGEYVFKAWVRPAGDAVGATLTAALTESADHATVKRGTRTVTLAPGWQQVIVTMAAAAAGHDLSYELSVSGLTGTGCVDVDDVSVVGPPGSANTYAATVLTDSPIAYYKLDDAAGSTTVADSSGNHRTGVVTGPVELGQSALTSSGGTAARLNAGYITVNGLDVDTAPGAQTTVEFWTDIPAYTSARMPFGFTTYDLYMTSGAFGFNTGQADLYGTPWDLIGPGRHHVVAVFTNGSVAANKLYVDGRAMPLSQLLGATDRVGAVTSTARIGSWAKDTSYLWQHPVDEVAIYRGALPADRVLDHYAAGAPAADQVVYADSPIAYYKLDELNGTVALDSSGHSRHGTIGGTVQMNQAGVAGSGRSINFAGTGWVDLAGLPVAESSGAATTVEMWLDAPAVPGGPMPFGFTSYDVRSVSGALGFNTGNGDLTGAPWSVLGTGRHHVVAVFTNGDSTGNKLYVDGVEQQLTTKIGTPAEQTVTSTARISGWVNSTAYSWPYRIDNVAVFNGALPPERVQAHYTASR